MSNYYLIFLIKDQKTINNKEEYSNRLVIPTKEFTTTLSKIGFTRKKNMDQAKVNYLLFNIVQVSALKYKLEDISCYYRHVDDSIG